MPISLNAINSTLAFSVENMFYDQLIHMCGMTHSLLWCLTCLHLSTQSILRWPSPWRKCSTRNSFICVPWLVHHYDAWHTYISHRNQFYVGHLRGEYVLWHDSFMCITWLMHHRGCDTWLYLSSQLILRRSSPWRMCSTNHSLICMTHSLFWCVTCLYLSSHSISHWPSPWEICFLTWLVHMCDMTHSPQWCVTILLFLAINFPSVFAEGNVFYDWIIRMNDMTHSPQMMHDIQSGEES